MQDGVVDVVERRMARMNVLYDANLAGCCAQCEALNSSLKNKYASARPAIRGWNVIKNHHIDIVWVYLLFIALGFNSLALRTYILVIQNPCVFGKFGVTNKDDDDKYDDNIFQ